MLFFLLNGVCDKKTNRNQRTEIRKQKTGNRNQKSEHREQITETREQKAENGNQKADIEAVGGHPLEGE